MRVLAVVLFAAAFCAAAGQQATVLQHVYLRANPSTQEPAVATLKKGQRVILIEAAPQSGFFHVKTTKGLEGWVGATYLSTSGLPDLVLSPSFAVATSCDPKLWDHVYNPERLVVKQKCISVTGTIVDATHNQKRPRRDGVRKEADGDTHGWLKVDPQFENLLNAGNLSYQEGNLVFEIVCKFKVSQQDAKASCPASFNNTVSLPAVGSHVRIVGTYIQESNHGRWMEIHPVSSITVIP
jgi:hypothetical protein